MSVNAWQGANTWADSGVQVSISELFSGFSESISASASKVIAANVTEVFNGFSESINATILEPGSLSITITESFDGFVEGINIKFPSSIPINLSNKVTVKRKSNTLRVRK